MALAVVAVLAGCTFRAPAGAAGSGLLPAPPPGPSGLLVELPDPRGVNGEPRSALTPTPVGSTLSAAPGYSEDSRRLLGLYREAVIDMLGAPQFIRREGPAQLWRYSAETCQLDVFLFRDREGLKVTHVETRLRGPQRLSLRSCVDRLVVTRDSRQES